MMAFVRAIGLRSLAILIALLLIVAPPMVALAPVAVVTAFEDEDHEVESLKVHAAAERSNVEHRPNVPSRQRFIAVSLHRVIHERGGHGDRANPFSSLRNPPLHC